MQESRWKNEIVPILDEGIDFKIPFVGMSMYPFIVGGRDEVVITSVSNKTLKRGDIVLYLSEGDHVLHRIHHVHKDSAYIVGDAQSRLEGPVPLGNIIAVVSAIIRKGKPIRCDNLAYRILSECWLLARPLRQGIIRIKLR